MAKPNDPVDSPPIDPAKPVSVVTPEDPLKGKPLDYVIEVLANASGQLQGLKGAELKRHVAELVAQVQAVASSVQADLQAEESRKAAAAEVGRLIDVLARTSGMGGAAMAAHRDTIAKAFAGVDIEKMAQGLRLFADWLQHPTQVNEAEVKQLIEKLQATMGPMVGYDPAREDEARRERIKVDVQSRLDKIFRPDKKS